MIITGKKFSKPELSRVINGDTVLPEADADAEKRRLDLVLVEQHPEYNRSSLQNFIKSGFVKVNGKLAKKPNEQIEPDAIIELAVPERTKVLPQIPVIYEDEHVLVLDKPAGLLSMAKGEYCPEPTLEDYGLLVHRLDRDTSGVVILAKDEATQSMLRRQFQDRKTHKTYLAIVSGVPKHAEALIDLPISRNLKHPTTFQVDQNGKPAQTYYRVLKSQNGKSLLELKPKTGRTHQLRVHLRHLGTPILGDPVYGEHRPNASTRNESRPHTAASSKPAHSDINSALRLMLHAHELEITIPGPEGGVRKILTSPLPEEFKAIMER